MKTSANVEVPPRDGQGREDADVTFDRERAETMRARLRWILLGSTLVWVLSYLIADPAVFTREQATLIRAPECALALLSFVWLRRPRALRAIEIWAVATWGFTATVSALGLVVVPDDKLAAKVAGLVLSILFVCWLAALTWRANAAIALLTLLSLSVLKARHAEGLLTLTLTVVGFAYVVVIVSAAARDRLKRAELTTRLALLAANEELRRDDELRRRLFTNLSHDLRTPLAVIRAEAERLRASSRFDVEDAALFRVEANARALADLADQLLDLARLEAGQMPLQATPCDVGRIARDVAALLEPPGGRPIVVAIEGSPIAHADAAHVHRILSNLVANARRHAPDDVTIQALREGDRVVVSVIDGGPNVPPERREAIFQRFVSFDSDGNTASGIGVPLARELATLNGGSLELVARAAKTTFQLTLPATDEPASAETTSASPPLRPPSTASAASATELDGLLSPSLLVVEDHPDMAATLRAVLEPRFRVDHAASVNQALARLEQQAPDAVLTDVLLPDGSGYDVLRAVRASRELERVPVVLVSALGATEERVRGLAAGADDYVAKPFAPDELLGRVVAAVRRAEARKRALDVQRETLLMEVHDGVSASLARASMLLASGSATELEFAREAIRDGLEEVRSLTRLLAPRPTEWGALTADVRRAMADACKQASLELDFLADDDPERTTVEALAAHTLRRAAREATTNAIKHAHARRLTCRITLSPSAFGLRVDDDGDGFPEARTDGLGLGLLARRVSRAGGSVELGRGARGGAEIALTIPREP